MCQKTRSNAIEGRTQDIYGNPLTFYAITHGHLTDCKEYVIAKEAFNFKRWLIFMTIFSSLAFYCEFYNADANFLGVFLFILCVVLILKLHLKVKQESLLVIASLGLQLTTTFVTGRKESQFIFNQNIYDAVINEGIYMHTFPRLDCLEKIYCEVQNSLRNNYYKSKM
ncbi:phosphatidylinositol N-acetylglucosaminyltransferase subunit H-like isoform X2 [Argiope bruennichi]|uniref:Phosphatidylinositol like protein n=1 Tax=Argiope bruennichi TaxID=94029 RepID=A0A8T0G0S7_ARGBR|nr:phosphatidylinositol N-acetylglucosaminyltransferase subunit H-like isoform X2 [Argiope bruennichi]KAF8795570.1 Phosphatidylinositol like protein [Argiope bruennichi]